jgi:hypothetical protein
MRSILFVLALAGLCAAFSTWQRDTLQLQFVRYGAPKGSVALDCVMAGGIAFTELPANHVYIAGGALALTPNTFTNVAAHEVLHIMGHTHGDGHPLMAYTVRRAPDGHVLEDAGLVDP